MDSGNGNEGTETKAGQSDVSRPAEVQVHADGYHGDIAADAPAYEAASQDGAPKKTSAAERTLPLFPEAGIPTAGHGTGCMIRSSNGVTKIEILLFRRADIFDDELRPLPQRQVGLGFRLRWDQLCVFLAHSHVGDPERWPNPDVAKRACGGWAAGSYQGNHRAIAAFLSTWLIVLDIDHHASFARVQAALEPFEFAAHSTYKDTEADPRCRVVLLLHEPCTDARVYKQAHAALRQRLVDFGFQAPDRARGIAGDVDDGASDVSRLSYRPMHHPERAPRFLAHEGERLDLGRLLAAHERRHPQPQRQSRTRSGEVNDAYRQGALRHAAQRMQSATVGDRHALLFRQAASLVRPELGIPDADIERTLLPSFVRAAGGDREEEGERTIRDAVSRSGT